MELQTTFYILAIIFMSLMLMIVIALAIALFKIKAKINIIHQRVEEKLNIVSNIAHLGSDVITAAKKVVTRR